MIRIAVSPRAYLAIKSTLPEGSVVYAPERNSRGQYLLSLSETEANRLSAIPQAGGIGQRGGYQAREDKFRDVPRIRIAITPAAFEAIAATLPLAH